jgi:hypothetical protein
LRERQRQPVLLRAGWGSGHDVDGQRKLLHHAAHHHQLLVVLLAEQRPRRPCPQTGGKQLHHHRAHAGEEAGAELPFQNVGQLLIGVYLEGLRLGVQLLLAGGKQHIAACSSLQLARSPAQVRG